MPWDQEDDLYRAIVENARDAVITADREGLIRLWNTGAERMFGFSKAEALGQSLDLIIPELLRNRHWEGYRKVMAEGRSRYESDLLAVPALKKDGSRISVEFTLVPVQDEHGRLEAIAAILRDVTERWNRDKALRQRLRELEAQCRTEGGETTR
ncbi:MAG: PAS domain S-box protein [Syntrophobacteraceae bacterium]